MNDVLPPSFANVPTVSASRMAMYEGLIALAWANGPINEAKRQKLTSIFTENRLLTEDQRQFLFSRIEEKVLMEAIWPHITEPQDRAYLLDFAERIFWLDGEYSELERNVYQEYLEHHLTSIGFDEAQTVMKAYAAELAAKRKDAERRGKQSKLGAHRMGAGWSFWDSQL